jgi:tetratricopeptide (TPR) repeat protein
MLPGSQTNADPVAKAEANARKAIELAPNLAAGHAALALALGFEGPVARQAIERAVQLDPSDHEAVMWLGNTHSRRGDKRSAHAAYVRAAEMEPLFWPAVLNQLLALQALGDEAGIEALIAHEQRLGADHLVAAIQVERAISRGALGEAANVGMAYLASGSEEGRPVIQLILWPLLLQLGFDEVAADMGPTPPFGPPLWRNDPKGLDMVERMGLPPRKFFAMSPLPQNAGRVYVLSGRSSTLADLYLSLALPPRDFAKLCGPDIEFVSIAPIVAIALRKSGHPEEAAKLLAHAEQVGETLLKSGEQVHQAMLARVYAAQERKDEALSLLASAVSRNWLPTPPTLLVDLQLDPALGALHGDPRFERIRQQILGTIKREKAKVRVPPSFGRPRQPSPPPPSA